MTKQEFEKSYADKSGVTIEWLHQNNQHAVRCNCECSNCNGWMMASIHENASSTSEIKDNK